MKLFLRDLSGGLNKAYPPHLIADNELSECSNVVYRNGIWNKRPGYTLPYSATVDTKDIVEICDYIRNDGSQFFLAFTTQNIYKLVGTSWTSVKALAVARTLGDKWFTAELGNSIYATNGVDALQVAGDLGTGGFSNQTWDTTTDAAGNVGITLNKCKIVLAFNSRLLFFNTDTSTDGVQPTRFNWTEVNTFNRINSQNFINLDYSQSPIISARIIGNNLIAVYKTDSFVTIQDVGSPQYFLPKFRQMTGLIAPKAVCDLPNGHFFISQKGFFINNAGGVIPVGNQKVKNYFYNNVNPNALNTVYCFSDDLHNEVYILYPTGSNTQPDHVLLWNYEYDTWAEWGLNANCGFYRYRTINSPTIYFGYTLGNVRQQGGTTDNGSAINSKIHTKAFIVIPDTVHVVQTQLQPVVNEYIQVGRIETDASPTTTTVKVGYADLGTDTPTFVTNTITDEDGKAPRADFSVFGRYITLGLENFDTASELVPEFQYAGQT